MYLSLLIIFLLQVFNSAINTLKTLFMTKGISKPAYLLTLIDSATFAWGMKLTVSGDGSIALVIFAIGKTIGTILGDFVEKRLAIGTLEVTITAKYEKAIPIADHLRDLGYSVNTRKVHGVKGNERYEVCLFIQRKEFEYIKYSLKRLGYENISMAITDVTKVTGKIQTSKRIEI